MNGKLIIPACLESWAAENTRVRDILDSEYAGLLKSTYNALLVDELFTSKVHGVGHIERAILLGAIIAKAQKLDLHEAQMLLLCCSYHDTGRKSDWLDTGHGEVSAQKITRSPLKEQFADFDSEDFAVMRAAIAAHSASDTKMSDMAPKYGVNEAHSERFFRIARCLKDADNLDRVRIHDLDVRHLRHEESVALADFAQWLLEKYEAALK